MNWYLTVLKKYAVFSGRARRKEYWMFVLFNVIIGFALSFIEGMLGMGSGGFGSGMLYNVYSLAVLIPSIAVGIRRMHDVGKSGWFLLIPIYGLILLCTDSDNESNKYGANPRASVDEPQSSVQS